MLLDTSRCPACFAPLTSARCARCGLDVSADGAVAVFAASEEVVRAIAVRDRAIAAMRAAQTIAEAAPTPAAPAPIPQVAVAPPAPPEPQAAPRPATPERPRRSGVQILLLVAGVVAVSVAAIFFALIAVLVASAQVRAGILAAGAVAVLAAAVLLRRRLPSTGEGVAVAGLVMLLLDLLLIRTAFALQSVDAAIYTGLGLLVVAGVGGVLASRAALRAGSITASVLGPLAAALVVGDAVDRADPDAAVWLAASAAVVVSATGLTVRRRVESVILRSSGAVAAPVATVAAALVPVDASVLRLAIVGPVALLAAGWLLAADRLRPAGYVVDRFAAAGIGAVAALLAIGSACQPLVGPIALVPVLALLPAAGAVTVSRSRGRGRVVALVATTLACLVGACYAIPALFDLASVATGPLTGIAPPFASGTRWSAAGPVADTGIGTAGLVAILIVSGVAARRRGPSTAAAATLAVGALTVAAASGTATALLPAAVLVGAACVVALGRLDGEDTRWPVVLAVLAIAIGAIAVLSLRGVDLWPVAVVAALGLTAAFRIASKDTARTALASGAFVTALLLIVTAAVPWARAAGLGLPADTSAAAPPFALAGVVLLVVAVRGRRIAVGERAAAQGVAVLALAAAGTALAIDARPATAAAAAVGLGAAALAALVWVGRDDTGEPGIAAITGPPLAVAAALGGGLAATDGVVTALVPLCGAAGVLVVAAASLLRARRPYRQAWEVAGAVAALGPLALLPTLGAAAWTPPLLLTAVGATMVAFADGDPFRAGPRRRVAGWAAIALVLIAVWRAVADHGTVDVEPYVLPAAAALLAVAVVAAFRSPDAHARSALAVTGAGLAIVPSALATLAGDGPRGVVVALVSAAMVVLSIVAPASWRGIAVRAPLAVLGAPVLALVALVEGGRLLPAIGGTDAWWLPATVLLLAVAVLQRTRRAAPLVVLPPLVAGSSVAGLVALDTAALRIGLDARLVVALLLLGAVHVALVARTPPGAREPAVPVIAGGIAAAVGVLVRFGTDRPLEAATIPLGAALLAAGALRMHRDPEVRTWPALGPGLAVLLLPSLALDVTPAGIPRVVTLGAVALAVFLIGAIRQLSAPFLLGGGVFVVHVLAQLWPWIQQIYLAAWWLWIGLAGALLIAIAARYERRVRDLRQAVRLLGTQR